MFWISIWLLIINLKTTGIIAIDQNDNDPFCMNTNDCF